MHVYSQLIPYGGRLSERELTQIVCLLEDVISGVEANDNLSLAYLDHFALKRSYVNNLPCDFASSAASATSLARARSFMRSICRSSRF